MFFPKVTLSVEDAIGNRRSFGGGGGGFPNILPIWELLYCACRPYCSKLWRR